MSGADPDLIRRGLLAAIAGLWLVAAALVWVVPPTPQPKVVVVHWANGHPMDQPLLPAFAQRFNVAGHRIESGKRIEVRPHLVNSGIIRREVVRRVQTGVPINRDLPDPTVITPVARHWFHDINYAVDRAVVDIPEARDLVATWIGIATFREMAECLGWPHREIGYSDIVDLASDPAGWSRYPCNWGEWGKRPLVTYTDPNRSTTGRSVLFSLYALAAGKAPEHIAEADVLDERVTGYLRAFQRSVAHYVPDSLILMDEMFAGPRYGHFFFIAEDNLVKLYKGKLVGTDPELERILGRKGAPGPLDRSMVMIYPREGSTAHTHPAAPLRADWVTDEQAEAARRWIAFLREDAQQSVLMDEGFRPATALPVRCPICGQYGLDPKVPKAIDPSAILPPVAQRMVDSWGDVKNPSVVVFVLDTSLSMAGEKLAAAREGIIRAVDGMYHRNLVGLLTFSAATGARVEPAPVTENRSRVWDTLQGLRAERPSALYEAIGEGIQMADRAPAEPNAIRGVVVLAGSRASAGAGLQDLIRMVSKEGKSVGLCPALARDESCVDEDGRAVPKAQVMGLRLTGDTQHPVGVYFIGIGDNVDLDVGRLIAEATGSHFVGTTVDDLEKVVKIFSEYF